MVYTFHRKGGFYPLNLASDEAALENVKSNPGTLRVVNESAQRVIYDIRKGEE